MIFITGANGWLGLNLVSSIVRGRTEKWGLKKNKIKTLILEGSPKDRLLKISPDIDIVEGDITNKRDLDLFFE